MTLMLDPGCPLRRFWDALHVGKACDEGNCVWYDDPLRDGGHRRTRLRAPTSSTVALPTAVSACPAGPDWG